MDYLASKYFSRKDIRYIALLVRKQLQVKTIIFPVIKILDKLEQLYPNDFYYTVEDDSEFEPGVMAVCEPPNEYDEQYHIRIRESVYNGATGKSPDMIV